MRENGRSERPQNRTDAIFSGRSMVEMLGVLAIIGVLSVGAMSGYRFMMPAEGHLLQNIPYTAAMTLVMNSIVSAT